MLADQLEYSDGQPFIVAGQHVVKFRARLPSGAGDAQRAEGFLQLPAAVTDQGVRPLRRYAEHGRHLDVIEVVPQAQLDRLALVGRQRGQRGADQPPQVGRLLRGRASIPAGSIPAGSIPVGSIPAGSIPADVIATYGGTVQVAAVHVGTSTWPPQALAAGRAEQPQAHLGRVAQAVA
jgi:hypothetical protein